MHDRDKRELVRQSGGQEMRVATGRLDDVVAQGLRLDKAEIRRGQSGDGPLLIVPLGQQRALGVVVVENPAETGHDEEVLSTAGELSRQLSAAIENKLLLSQIRERHSSTPIAARTHKLAALGQFVAGIAHELNNPLQSVLGHLELLRRSLSCRGGSPPTSG